MTCEKCNAEKNLIIRTVSDAHSVERTRECCTCSWRWTTVEAKSEEYRRLTALLEAVRELPGIRDGG